MKNDLLAFSSLTRTSIIELARSRIYVAVLVAGIVIVVSSVLFERLAAGEGGRMIVDVGGAFVTLLASALGVVTAIARLSREIETKRLYHFVFRPFSRGVVPLASFAASSSLVLFTSLLLGTLLSFLGWYGEWPAPERALLVTAVGALEGVVVCAIAVLFASTSSSAVAAVNSCLLFLVGRLAPSLEEIAQRTDVGGTRVLLKAALVVSPRLDRFDATGWVEPVTAIGPALIYAALYAAGVLILAAVLFSRREL
jgi:ABC-type transport system involved in multi-copper enzyme maturation permease subunit